MFKSYGLNQNANAKPKSVSSKEKAILETFAAQGYVVLEGILSPDEIDHAKNSVRQVYEQQEKEFGRKQLAEINELEVARALLLYDRFFLKQIALNSKIFPFIQLLIDGPPQLHLQNGIINRSEETHHQSSWHRDLPYQNWVCSKPLAVNAFYCLCEFNSENGGTWFLPGSHLLEEAPTETFILKNGIQPKVTAGSVILFHSMLIHKAGQNNSKADRIGINNLYTVPIIKQQINLALATAEQIATFTEAEKLLLGFEYDSPTSVLDWRKKRHKKLIRM